MQRTPHLNWILGVCGYGGVGVWGYGGMWVCNVCCQTVTAYLSVLLTCMAADALWVFNLAMMARWVLGSIE
jgi:hypothetical protein